jgi:hypothetical protein
VTRSISLSSQKAGYTAESEAVSRIGNRPGCP